MNNPLSPRLWRDRSTFIPASLFRAMPGQAGLYRPCDDEAFRRSRIGKLRPTHRTLKFLCLSALLIGSASFAMDVRESDRGERLRLMVTNQMTNFEGVKELLDAGVPVDAQNKYGRNSLIYAARDGNKEMCRLLLDRNAQIDIRTNDGETPLFFAAWFGHQQACRLLLDHNAQADIRTNNGETPLIVADRYKYNEICRMLVDAQIEQRKAAVVAFLGIKKFRKVAFLRQIDSHVIRLIAHQVFDTEMANLVAHINKIEKIKEYVLAYALKKLKMDKTIQGTSHE